MESPYDLGARAVSMPYTELRDRLLFIERYAKLVNHVEQFGKLSNYGTIKVYDNIIADYRSNVQWLKSVGVKFP
jgi:hypothetical protein